VIGENALEVYNTFAWDDEGDAMKVDKIMEKFAAYCTPRKNITYERHIFNTRNQRAGETIDQYVTDLRTKAKSCEFGTLCDSLIRDRIVCGIIDDKLRARLLREGDLTLQKAIDICRANEVSLEQAKSLTNVTDDVTSEVNALKTDQRSDRDRYNKNRNVDRGRFQKNNSETPTTTCTRCGGKHGKQQQCPAMGATCHKCQKPNHYSRMCKTRDTKERKVHSHEAEEKRDKSSDSESNDSFFIGTIDAQDENKEWTTSLKIDNKNIKFKSIQEQNATLFQKKRTKNFIVKPV
jgi:hypothetical protein